MLSKEEWEEFEKNLSYPYGWAELFCDGYKVTFNVEREGTLRFAIVWYIDRKFKGKWLLEDCEIRRKFARPSVRNRWKKNMWKGLPKRMLKRMKIDPDEKVTVHLWHWNSAKSLRRHLVKNCDKIEWVKP
ncbi:hypothetical protein [Desulfonatronovibrio hydrogenovorans]|uniref:hypothetical protein n=1 Tax=Desulfonatronovibrio hydrogenovorans TaxID=53245 RepID=UPI00068A69E0|nr:hypothetical protein [Desulfonatronovibrio hydrogenovorans]